MSNDGVLSYLHSDHLNSASLATDASGNKVAGSDTRYTPFGQTRANYDGANLPTDRRYTGQREVADLGLYDYNARYYDPYIGRFIQADTVIPDPGSAQAYNRYSYVNNNPLKYNDPSGHMPSPPVILGGFLIAGLGIGGAVGFAVNPSVQPWNPPMMVGVGRTPRVIASSDMTVWLLDQMTTNAKSDIVGAIRENLTSGNPAGTIASMQAWTALVGTDATWDFKVDIRQSEWFEDGERNVTLGNSTLNFDAIANIHYGFVGRAAGFGAEFLLQAAGAAQFMRARKTGKAADRGTCNLTYYCDHPFATWSIGFGTYLYDHYSLEQLNEETFSSALEEYIRENGEPPDPPEGALLP